MNQNFAVLTAGGRGVRLGFEIPKQFISIHGIPLITHTLLAFEKAREIHGVVVVLPKNEVENFEATYVTPFGIKKFIKAVAGGETRQASVHQGLLALTSMNCTFAAIHDAARCLITPELIDRAMIACQSHDGVIVAQPVRDTLKKVSDYKILETVPREQLWGMQTPQIFKYPFILNAYNAAREKKLEATDDAQVAEFAGGNIFVIEGATTNLKVTYPEDVTIAEAILAKSV